MAEEIVIKTVLDLSGSERRLQQQVEKVLGSPEAQTAAKNAGKKIGDALGLGIETTRKSREDKELAHMRRLEAISAQSNARLVQIEARKQAQLDAIRERGLQKEIEHQRKIERETQRATNAFGSLRTAIAGVAGVFTALGAAGAVRFFEDIARRSIDAAIAIDRQVNSLKALTGSAEQAKARFAELFALAQRTPGLTTGLASTLDVQLRILDVSEKTINRLLPVVGRLNAISPLGDPSRFAGNLVQLITQNFERQDLKELVGNSPFAGQLIKELFNVDSPTNAKAIRESAQKLGINTIEEFFNALAQTAENNPKLQAVTESLATQFDKLQDRIQVALAPIGDELLKAILPAFRELVELLEQGAPKISALLRDNRDEIIAIASAFVTAANAAAQLVAQFSKLGQQLGIIRLISLATVAITPGGAQSFFPLMNAFEQADRRRASLAGRLPFGVSIEETLGAIRDPTVAQPGRGISIGADRKESESISKAARERARELAEAKKNSAQALDEFMKGNVEDLEDLTKIINQANAQAKKDRDFRARRLIEGRETRQRLTEEFERAEVAEFERTSRRGLTRSGRFVGDAFNRGAITPGEAEALSQAANRDFANKLRELLALEEQRGKLTAARKADLEDEIELYDRLGTAISDTERFTRGFNSAIETSGDIWERFGQNVSNAFRNVKDLFNGLKSAVLGFFNDLLGNSIQNLVRGTLGGIFGGGGGGGRGGGGGIGGILGGLFGGGGISAAPSVSAQSATGIFANGAFGAGLRGATGGGGGGILGRIFGSGGGSAGGGGFSLGGLFGGLASAAPLLGLSLGSGLGGQSTAGNILGALGGGAVGLGLSFGASVFSAAGGGLAALGPAALAALGPAALIGAPLLVGAVLLGRARQRGKDEEASGQFLTQALDAISQLRVALDADQIEGGQAAAIFETQILGTFKQQISGLKTKSVVESRLTNQVADLRRTYNDVIVPGISAQSERRSEEAASRARAERAAFVDSRLVPEFARGGTTMGGLALLHPGEKVLNQQQQANILAMAGPGAFERAGVPGVKNPSVFDTGGTMGIVSAYSQAQTPIIVQPIFTLEIGSRDASRLVSRGVKTSDGRKAVVDTLGTAGLNKELG
jgi:hypothetical protein